MRIASIGWIIDIKLNLQAEFLAIVLLAHAWIDFNAATIGSKDFANSIDHDRAHAWSETEDWRLC